MRKVETLAAVRCRISRPAAHVEHLVVKCCTGEGGPIPRIPLDRLTEQIETAKVNLLVPFS